MPPIYGWTIKRAGSAMTITHNAGKLTNVERVEPRNIEGVWHIVAVQEGGNEYTLQPGAPTNAG